MEQGRKYNKRYCIVYGCLNTNKSIPDLSLFSLPKDAERRRQWLTLIGREELLRNKDIKIKNFEVCNNHFDESAIKIIKQLKNNAVPTKLLPKEAQYCYCISSTASVNRIEEDKSQSHQIISSDDTREETASVTIKTHTKIQILSPMTSLLPTSPTHRTPQKQKLSKDLQNSGYKRRRSDRKLQ